METNPISSLYIDLPSSESREHFHALTGRHAPVFNRAKKRWADPSKLNLPSMDRVTYLVFNGTELAELTMSAIEAVNPNFSEKDFDQLPEVPWPCRPLAEDERIVIVDGVAVVQKGTE